MSLSPDSEYRSGEPEEDDSIDFLPTSGIALYLLTRGIEVEVCFFVVSVNQRGFVALGEMLQSFPFFLIQPRL